MTIMGIRVVIADGLQIFREGLAAILTSRGIGVVGMARTGEEAILVVRQRDADIVLLDRDLPGLDSFSATKLITKERASVKVLVMVQTFGADGVSQAGEFGVTACVLKRVAPEELVAIIIACVEGRVPVSPFLASLTNHRSPANNEQYGVTQMSDCSGLSPQEQRVLRLIVKGLSNKEIANAINISQDTVKAHLKQIYDKLGVDNRTKAAVTAIVKKLV